MHTGPMKDSEGDFSGARLVEGLPCRACGAESVEVKSWESHCGGYEDDRYECRSCGHVWWIEGPDA